MSSSLSSLVGTLSDADMHITREKLPNMTDEQFEILRRKGVYPYDWMDSPEKLKNRELPPISDFYNRLTESPCSEEDYEHAKKAWEAFGMKTMQDYHDLYLKSDITLLADVVEKFRSMCMKTYGLDPSWNITTPGLSWDAMFKTTGVELKTIPDPNIHLFFEEATRGGISVITKRHAEANHKYMDSYDPDKPSVFIAYLDMNNLYGCAMADPLPNGDLWWMSEEELENWRDLVGENMGDDTGTGCFLEVDLDYPDDIHDLHSDYPMACERVDVGGNGDTKLVPNLNNKFKYIIHHDELRQCLKHGLILRKVHRGVMFRQSKWLAPYIHMNTRLRAESTTKFGQDFFKLMVNSVYGKTMENVRNWLSVELVKEDRGRLRRLRRKPNYKGELPFLDGTDEPLVAVDLGKSEVKMDKPIYVGATVLSISKVKMCRFFYEYVRPKWGDRVKLLFTDTDSLCLEIHTEDFYADIMGDVGAYFDTSSIPSDHRAAVDLGFPTGENKKVLGMMKDEVGGKNIVEYVGLRPKMYSLSMEGEEKDVLKCKGVKRYVVENMVFEEYKKCLFENSAVYKTQNTLRNRNHRIYVERMTKKALCGRDNKRVRQ